MNIVRLLERCNSDIQQYRDYLEKFPYEFRVAMVNSPLNIEYNYSYILLDILPADIWEKLNGINWQFPNQEYDSIDDFIIKNNLENKKGETQ